MKNKLFFLILFILTCLSVTSQITTTTSSGNWDTPGNWTNGVPADGGTATVNQEMTLDKNVTIFDGNYTVTDAGKITDPNGGGEYNIDVRGTGYFEISGNVSIGGDLEVRNSAEFRLQGCDTMRIRGDVVFSNNTTITVEACAVLIIDGDFDLRNDNATTINGNVTVGGDLTSRNSAFIVGSGNIQTAGETEIRNSSSVFGSTTGCAGPCEYGSGIGLPIELLSFDAKHIGNENIEITWKTLSELNNNYFTLDYITDGENFVEIAEVEGAGNSQVIREYRHVFEHEAKEVIYLRLTQTDYDGQQESFDLIAVSKIARNEMQRHEELSAENLEIVTFPNPSRAGEINITASVTGGSEETSTISIHNLNGALIFQKTYTPEEISNSIRIEDNRVRKLSKGIYIISVLNGDEKSTEKYIVL